MSERLQLPRDDRRRSANDERCRERAESCSDTATPSSSGFDWARETQQSDGSPPRVSSAYNESSRLIGAAHDWRKGLGFVGCRRETQIETSKCSGHHRQQRTAQPLVTRWRERTPNPSD